MDALELMKKKKFGKMKKPLKNEKKIILKKSQKECQVGNQKVLKNLTIIKSKMEFHYLRKIQFKKNNKIKYRSLFYEI